MKKIRNGSKRLRLGRVSEAGQIYLVTAVTRDRVPVFEDFHSARLLINTLRLDASRGSHRTLCYVVMPDHIHWLLQLEQGTLSQLVGRVKSVTAHKLGKPIWQKGFHDHALRSEEDIHGTARYIVANPLRAGLVKRLGDYPHWDAAWL